MRRFIPNRSFELLEAKRMNAANLIGNALAAMPAGSNTVQTSTSGSGSGNGSVAGSNLQSSVNGSINGSLHSGLANVSAGQNVAGATRLSGSLSGTGQGAVNLVSRMANGTTGANFLVRVSGAPANQTFDVSLGGNVVGSISTNAQGNGILHLNSALGNADQLLAALPGIGANAGVSIGVSGQTPILSGTLQAGANVGLGLNASNLTGALGGVTNLENQVLSRLDSVISNLDARVNNAVDKVVAVTDKVDGIANQLVGRVDTLAAAVVDKVFGLTDSSGLLGSVGSLLPNDVTHLV